MSLASSSLAISLESTMLSTPYEDSGLVESYLAQLLDDPYYLSSAFSQEDEDAEGALKEPEVTDKKA